jgi:hypothetical protein
VALGLARASEDPVGKRPRTSYAITTKGRKSLAQWLAEPGAGPVLEFEQLLQITFADQGTKQNALDTLAATRAWALERNEENLAAGRAYTAGVGPFQHRVAINALGGRFLTDYYALVNDWAEWAIEQVERWPDDPAAAEGDRAEMEESVRRAERTAGLA